MQPYPPNYRLYRYAAARWRTRPYTTFEEMSHATGDSLGVLANSDEEQDREDKEYDEDDTELGKLSDDDEPGSVMGTISKTVQHRLESFRPMQMKLD